MLGTIPYDSFQVDEEDSQQIRSTLRADASLRIHVVHLPQLSNFTDFAPLQRQPDISLEYVEQPSSSRLPDVLILPGSKNTLSDLQTLRERGWEDWIQQHLGSFLLVGIWRVPDAREGLPILKELRAQLMVHLVWVFCRYELRCSIPRFCSVLNTRVRNYQRM